MIETPAIDTSPLESRATAAIESAEARAWADVYSAAPADWAAEVGLGFREVAGALVIQWAATGRRYFSRAIGLGVVEPASGEAIDEILRGWDEAGISMFLLQSLPHCLPADYEGLLRERGLEPFDAQDRVYRDGSPLAPLDPSDRPPAVERVTPETGDAWAEFNHNVAGLILIGLTLLALLDRWGVPGARHWPLGFVALAVFLLFRNDPEGWPLGPQGFWEGMKEGGILQHRLAVTLACVLGVLEWRARTQRVPTRLPYVFPLLAFVGGILLLTHSHTAFEAKSDFLLEIAHTGMGLLGIGVACGRLLELRLRPVDGGWWAGVASLTAMLLIGVILVFYHEPGTMPAMTALLGRTP